MPFTYVPSKGLLGEDLREALPDRLFHQGLRGCRGCIRFRGLYMVSIGFRLDGLQLFWVDGVFRVLNGFIGFLGRLIGVYRACRDHEPNKGWGGGGRSRSNGGQSLRHLDFHIRRLDPVSQSLKVLASVT